MEGCQALVDSYLKWLRAGLSVEDLGEACEVTTPFLDRHNDHLQVYATRENGKIILTDDGYILADLEASGVELDTPKRKAVLDSILKGLGVRLVERRLVVDTSPRSVGQRLHCLIQSMLAINDMFVMAQERVASFFWEDVKSFLEMHDVRFNPRVKLAGHTGFDHAIDFLIPKSKSAPERIVQAINAPSKNTIGSFLFALTDTRDARAEESTAYAFLNDSHDRPVGGEVLDALEAYDVRAVVWSHRDEYSQELAD